MAENLGTVYWRVEADTSTLKKAEAEMDAVGKKATESGAKVDKFGDELEGTGKRGSTAMKTLGVAIAAVVTSQAVKQVVQYADSWQNATNQLKTVQKETESLAGTQAKLMAISNESRQGFESTANLYTRLSRSTESLNLSQGELIDLTETINKSFAVSGASAQEASNAIIQLSQGLAAGALRGEEFNSVSEQSPILMQAIADHLQMTRGELRDFAAEGGITAEIVVASLQEASAEIDNTFSKMAATYEQNMTIAKNNLLEFVGSSETVQRVTSSVGGAIVGLSENIDTLGNVMISAGVGVAAMGAVHLVTLTRGLTLATAAQAAFNRVAMLNPYVLGAAAIGTLTLAIMEYTKESRAAAAETRTLVDETLKLVGALDLSGVKVLTLEERMRLAVMTGRDNVAVTDEQAGSTAAFSEEVQELINKLTQEREALDLSGAALEVYNVLTKNGIDASSEAGKEIARLVTQNYNHAKSLKDATDAAEDATEAEKKLTEEIEKQRKKVGEAILGMRQKEVALALTGKQQYIYNAIVAAGAMGDAGQATAIAEAAAALYDKEAALKAASDAESAYSKASEDAAEIARDSWQRTHESLSQNIEGLIDDLAAGGDAFKFLEGIAISVAKRIASEWLALQGMNLFGIPMPGGGGGSSPLSTAASLAGSASSIGGFLSGFGGTATGVAAGTVGPPTAAAAAGSKLATFATNPATLAIAGLVAAVAAHKKFSDPDNYTRSFAGLLTAATPGAAGLTFDAGTFASGFRAQGIAKGASQQQAMQGIDLFRAIDQRVVDSVRALGGNIDLSNATLGGVGLDGRAGTQGTFLGTGGKTTAADIEAMLSQFTGDLLNHVTGIDEELLATVKAAGSAEEAMRLLTEAVADQQEPLNNFENAQKKAAESVLNAYNSGMNELDAINLAYQAFQQYADRGLTSEAIANFTGLMQSEIDAVLDRGRAAANVSPAGSAGSMQLMGGGDFWEETRRQSQRNNFVSAHNFSPELQAAFIAAGMNKYGDPIDGSHANGLDYVPFDGYVAELHKGERVMTAAENAAGSGTMIEGLRVAVARNSQLMLSILQRWDQNGMPRERAQ